MDCKFKIGCPYEPKQFDIRTSQGTYSGKNVMPDEDVAWLQNNLLGTGIARHWKTKIFTCAICAAVGLYVMWSYGVMP